MADRMKHPTKTLNAAVLLVLAVTGCASNVPELIRVAPTGGVRVEEVQQRDSRLVGNEVRWGGPIIAVHNMAQETLIEILSRDLSEEGKPQETGGSGGRFMARIGGFIEPSEYPKDRLLTVTGTVEEVIERPIGEYTYPYPVVDVKARYLWPETKRYPPRYYDPFYDPFFYPYPYPYWRGYPYYW